MNLAQVTKVANDAAQMTILAIDGTAPALYDGLTPDQQSDLQRTAASELGSGLDAAGYITWTQNNRPMSTEQAAHAAFQSVCVSLRDVYVPG